MDTRIKEAIRYLGYGRQAVDEPTLALIHESLQELEEIAEVKFVYRIFELSYPDVKTVQVNRINIQSANLVKNLCGCHSCIMLGITLGVEVDRVLQKYEKVHMAKAVVFQACAAAFLEEKCEELCENLARKQRENGKYLRPRFSPGYGDFSITHQKDILNTLEAQKKIGLMMTDRYMLTPTKSITAFIGISDEDVGCNTVGCETCEKNDCLYRRS